MANETCDSRCLSAFCGTLKAGPKSAGFLHQRKSSAGSDCSVNLLLPPLRISLFWLASSVTIWSGRHGAQDVDQLACADRGAGSSAGIATQLGRGADLDFEVAGDELQHVILLAQQHVGQDRQGMATLDNAGYGLQGAEDLGLGRFRRLGMDASGYCWAVPLTQRTLPCDAQRTANISGISRLDPRQA